MDSTGSIDVFFVCYEARTISTSGLNTSEKPWCLHPKSIKLVFYERSALPRLWGGFELRCFQLLSARAWLPSIALSDNW